ncbi:MAG: response regulator, partial [Patescibacteria group bacterium]
LNMMQKGGYDLILLDVMLPKMDGFQILEKLKDTPPEIPNNGVLILTNLGKDFNIAKGLALGARGYLMKTDITPDQVVQEVKSYLV